MQIPQAFWFPGCAGRAPSGSKRRSCAGLAVRSCPRSTEHTPGAGRDGTASLGIGPHRRDGHGQRGKGSWALPETAHDFFGQQNESTSYVFEQKKYFDYLEYSWYSSFKEPHPADTETLFVFFLVLHD